MPENQQYITFRKEAWDTFLIETAREGLTYKNGRLLNALCEGEVQVPENQHLTQEQTVRLLRAKEAELIHRFKAQIFNQEDSLYLMADVALLFGLLADHLENHYPNE